MGESTQRFTKFKNEFIEANKRWAHFVLGLGYKPGSTEPRYAITEFGRTYYIAHQWDRKAGLGYVYHGIVVDQGKPTERDVLKHTAAITGDARMMTANGSFPLSSEDAMRDYHHWCILQMDDEVAAGVPKFEVK